MGRLRSLVFLSLLLAPSLVLAAPITTGTWSPLGVTNEDGSPFWDGASADCEDCGVAAFLPLFGFDSLEYLHDGTGGPVSFVFPETVSWTRLFSLSLTPGVFGQRGDGAFTYDPENLPDSNSLDQGWQYALFRQVESDHIQYFVGVEDVRFDLGTPSDGDYNDFVATFIQARTVPEPAMLLLMGGVMLAFAARLRARNRRA